MSIPQVLPSEKIQKEFERNPLKLLEEINIEENSNENFEEKRNEPELINKPIKNPQVNDCINNLNTFKNNLNCKNELVNFKPSITVKDNTNIVLNSFNVFFNFTCKQKGNSPENNYVYKNVNDSQSEDENDYTNAKEMYNKEETYNDNKDNSLSETNNKSVNKFHLNISKLISNLNTYKGSIYAQSLLECIDKEKELSSFFNEIIPNICQIMCSEYGNYFFQKLIKDLSLSQRLQIYRIIQPEFLVIATNKWGTHSIQSLMNNIQSPAESCEFNLLISKNMYLLFTDNNAYHIMMKMILDFPEEQRYALNLYLVTNIDKIIVNSNGAFCVNKFIINNKNIQLRQIMVENLKINFQKLIYNKLYCINLLLMMQTFGVEWGSFILMEIQNNFIALIQNQVSRVFIIKVFEYLKYNYSPLLKELLWTIYKNSCVINYFMSNKGQKKFLKQLIELSDDDQKVYLYILLKKCKW